MEKGAVVRGLVSACRAAGCALIGGETADMPDLYAPGDFDLVGFIVGVVERDCIIDGSTIQEGDVLLGLPSSGLHTNGYSLVRQVFGIGKGGAQTGGRPADPAAERATLDRYYPGLGVTLGEVLLIPHRCYYQEMRPLLGHVKGMAHITGGGIPGNVARILPEGLSARFDRDSWRVPPIFGLIQKTGRISDDEMYHVFNMGLGMVLVCSEEGASAVQQALPEAKAVGRVVRRSEQEKRVILA